MEKKVKESRIELFMDALLIGVGVSLWSVPDAWAQWAMAGKCFLAIGIAMNLFNGIERIVEAHKANRD